MCKIRKNGGHKKGRKSNKSTREIKEVQETTKKLIATALKKY